jgi:hypothetical protein
MKIDRVENWRKFSEHMEKYIQEKTLEKYGFENGDPDAGAFDLRRVSGTMSQLRFALHYR